MSVIAIVAELDDWTILTGAWSYITSPVLSYYDPYYSRGAMVSSVSSSSANAYKSFQIAKTTVGACCRWGRCSWNYDTDPFFCFTSGGISVLGLQTSSSAGIKLVKWNGSSFTTLATGALPSTTGCRFDMFVQNYGAGARVKVWLTYLDGSAPALLWIDYSGDVTSPGVTDLDGMRMTIVQPTWFSFPDSGLSEVIAADEPTLRMRLKTCYPDSAGDINTFDVGSYADVDELATNISDYLESATADQEFLCGVTDIPSGSFSVLAVQATIVASKGTSGPSQIEVNVKSGGTVSYGDDQALSESYSSSSRLMTQNPVTLAAWQSSQIGSLQVGCKSIA